MNDNKKRKIIERLKTYLPVIIGTLVVVLLADSFPIVANIIENYVYPVFMLLMLILLIYMLCFLYNKKVICKKKLRKVSDEDLALIEEFSSIKAGNVPSELEDYIEDVSFLCEDFLEMKKQIFSRDFFDDEFVLEEINGMQEWLYLYNKCRKVVDIVYKYYDSDGKRMV